MAEALAGAEVVVDASNAPVWDDAAVLEFFETSSRNLTEAAASAGVKHYVAMSIVSADRLPESCYLRAKVAQEEVVKSGAVPFTLVRATQFFEFIGQIADSCTSGSTARVSSARFQPAAVAELDAAWRMWRWGSRRMGSSRWPAPNRSPWTRPSRLLSADGDPRTVVSDPEAPYFGTVLDTDSLVPHDNPHLTPTRLDDWLAQR